MPKSKIVERIEREVGIADLFEALTNRIKPVDLASLLIEVYGERAAHRTAASVLNDYEQSRFVRLSSISPLRLMAWEQIAFQSLPEDFEAIALAPVSPLGTSSAVGAVDQNRVISAVRNVEVLSDSTNVMALECALRRRELMRQNPKSREPVHLASSERLIRAQHYGGANSVAHFSLFGLCSAGRVEDNLAFELKTLVLQIGFYIRALRAFLGEPLKLRLAVTNLGSAERDNLIQTDIFAPIQTAFGTIQCDLDPTRTGGRNYYVDLCFHLYAGRDESDMLELVDGGAVNWTQTLLSNNKERCVISGIGSERVCSAFEK
ncbi:MAG: hypothetical protein H0X30_16850 [Anaerolineae bacterium]|nr:hypothetical protein [Anaerolineae bacterium]